MPEDNIRTNERVRLLLEAASQQEQSAQSQLTVALFLCAVAAEKLETGKLQSAATLMQEARFIADVVCDSSDQSDGAVRRLIDDVRTGLAQLEVRVSARERYVSRKAA